MEHSGAKLKTDEDVENTEADPGLPVPPDGGWGWVIVFASFMVHVIAEGIAYSFGVYVESFTEYFNCSKGEIGLLCSLMLGVTWGSGPIASALVNRYGCRSVTIGGTLIAAFGFVISIPLSEYFRDNIYLMYITFGIIAGLGLGMGYLPAIVSVSYYFEKRRSLATGLAVCGSNLGTSIFAPLTEILLNEYGWKGTVLIESGILLNCCICGAVLRPLRAPRRMRAENAQKEIAQDQGDASKPTPTVEIARFRSVNGKKKTRTISEGADLVTFDKNGCGEGNHDQAIMMMSRSESFINQAGKDDEQQQQNEARHQADLLSPMARKDVFYTASLDHIPLYKNDPVGYKRSMLALDTAPPDTSEDKSNECCNKTQKVMDFSLLWDVIFMLFAVSNLLTSIGFCIPYIYLPSRGLTMDFGQQSSAFLVSIIGISNTVGRILFGYLADFKCVNRLLLYNTVLLLCGITSIASSLCVNYGLMATYAASFGLFIGVHTCLTPVVLVDLLGLEKLSNAFGLVLAFQGIGAVIGPPMAGALYDKYENYDYSFYLMGVCLAVSGAMLYPIPCIKRYQNKADADHDIALGKTVTCAPIVVEQAQGVTLLSSSPRI